LIDLGVTTWNFFTFGFGETVAFGERMKSFVRVVNKVSVWHFKACGKAFWS